MNESSPVNFYIVGIGTSAGGLEALEHFFTNMPPDDQLAFVVVQHLSPDYKSHMVELLTKYTSLNVHEARDGMEVEPKNIYLIPQRKNMTIFKGKLYLVERGRSQGLNLPIDIFFESLAKDQGEKAIGIVLSGTGSDGTRGIRSIKEMGGMVVAQDATARFDGMPRSAVATQLVDYVIPPEEMPRSLLSYIKHPYLNRDLSVSPATLDDRVPLEKLFAILRNQTGIDFSSYKPTTILRRIARRMSINQIDGMAEYVKFLEQSPTESQLLYKEFLISVTRFFRDPEAFEIIKKDVIPELFKGRKPLDQIRVWVAGCATGEEAYSLAILFQEYMQETGQRVDVKIFATDIDQDALDVAGRGLYPESTLADISFERLQNFFIKRGDNHEILRHVRASVVFAYQNLIKDPPFSRIDLVSCRNLLIYLQPHLQKSVMGLFQFALKPGGFMLLGSSETVGNFSDVFVSHHNRWKIYRYEGDASPTSRAAFTMPGDLRLQAPPEPVRQTTVPTAEWHSRDSILRHLVEQLMPPCVVVNEKQDVIHAFGEVRQYLEAPIGYQVNLNIMNMVRPELSLPLSTALHRTLQNQEDVTYNHICLENAAEKKYINLTTRLFWERNNRQRLVLIIFEESDYQPPESDLNVNFDINQSAAQRIEDLELQLQYTKENLQATIEELETSNEELQATNEELMAANEELQSTNEELQSVNEELRTVNNEYQEKIRELTRLNNDINNLLVATDIGTIFLDSNLMVRRFTPSVQKVVNLIENDIDRPFKHISHNLVDIDLHEKAQQVLTTKIAIEQELNSQNNRSYLVKVSPYLTHSHQIDGIVISLVDVTHRRRAEKEKDEYRAVLARQQSIISQTQRIVNVGSWELNLINNSLSWSDEMYYIFEVSRDEFGGTYEGFLELVHPEDREVVKQAHQSSMKDKIPFHISHRVLLKDGSVKQVMEWGETFFNDDGQSTHSIGLIQDVSDSTNQPFLDQFQSAVLTSGDAFVMTNPSHPENPIVYVNPAFEKMSGYSADEVIGKNPRLMQGTDNNQPALEKLRQALRDGVPGQAVARNYRKDGTRFLNRVTIYPLKDRFGLIVRWLGIQQVIAKQELDKNIPQ
ncbi:MAG: PAS domain-containing protein [Ardenticatenaceae bacterium]|nr:PAS domain-containing protein [Ardenticatenaceae bacterium]